MSAEAWTFLGVLVTALASIAVAVIREVRKSHDKLDELNTHVNSVEEQVDEAGPLTLGQQTVQIRERLEDFILENRSVHEMILKAPPEAAVQSFKIAYQHADVPAYHLLRTGDSADGVPYIFEWCNHAFSEMTGLSLQEAKTQHPDTVLPEDRPRVGDAIKFATERGEDVEIRYKNRNLRTGGECEVVSSTHPYKSIGGEVLGYFGTMREIEEE